MEIGVSGGMVLDSSCILDDVRLFDLIGSGSFAKVFVGEWLGIQVAVKQLHGILQQETSPLEREGLTKTFYKELDMNMKLRHPNIIQFLGVVFPTGDGENCGDADAKSPSAGVRRSRSREEFPMMVMELMHCTLDARLAEYRENGARMPLSETVDAAADVAAALVYLHSRTRPIAHRDLAPKNILLSASGTAKLGDLGVAKRASQSVQKNTEGPGTVPYMPPEVRLGRNYSLLEVDLYSFGVTLLEMACGLEPSPKDFAHMKEDGSYKLVEERVRREKSFAAIDPSHPLLGTIDDCLQSAVSKRPTATKLLSVLRDLKQEEEYRSSRAATAKKTCCLCEKKTKKLIYLQETLGDQEREVAKLTEENKMLENFRDGQLKLLKSKLDMAAMEGERYQLQLREVQEALEGQILMNRQLEVTNDRTKNINHLLKQKVEMDSQLRDRPQKKVQPATPLEKSTSLRYEHRPKPIPKPRKRKESEVMMTPSKSTEKLDQLFRDFSGSKSSNVYDCDPTHLFYRNPAISMSMSSFPVALKDEQTNEDDTYLQLDAVAMLRAQENPLETRSLPASRQTSSEQPHAGLRKHNSTSSYENPDDPLYVKFPITEPPTPPPRDQEFRFTNSTKRVSSLRDSKDQRSVRPTRLTVIDEGEESAKSPQGTMTSRNQRTTQSMKSSHRVDCSTLAPPLSSGRPGLERQRSRGDILISEVLTSVKAKNPGDLTVKKGELVKVTNRGLEKKLCVAVKTNGESGTIKKKNLDNVEPVDIPFNTSNPLVSARKGVFSHIAHRSSPHGHWVSPIETMKILIIPSSLHSGDTGLLVKITDYVLCCTDDDEESKFDIDLREQRLLKLSGYVLQCHPEGGNGAPVHWTLEGSQNGRTWSHLSEESGSYFRKKSMHHFPVMNPTPCRYFRLTQLGKNTEGNFRFCLSGIEFYGQLYTSVVQERVVT